MIATAKNEEQKRRMEGYYASIAPKLTNFLVANGTDKAAADDIVQETFLRLWRMRDDLVDDAAQISGLSFTIARNLRNDKFRRASHEVLQDDVCENEEEDGAKVQEGPLADSLATLPSDREFLRQRLVAAFAQIPPLLREAYTLFQIQELPIREIARRTNVSESLVKVRIFRAKEKLRPLLADLL